MKTRREVVGTRGLILESPDSFSGPESCKFCVCHICLRDQSFKFDNDAMDLSVNEAKLTGL